MRWPTRVAGVAYIAAISFEPSMDDAVWPGKGGWDAELSELPRVAEVPGHPNAPWPSDVARSHDGQAASRAAELAAVQAAWIYTEPSQWFCVSVGAVLR